MCLGFGSTVIQSMQSSYGDWYSAPSFVAFDLHVPHAAARGIRPPIVSTTVHASCLALVSNGMKVIIRGSGRLDLVY